MRLRKVIAVLLAGTLLAGGMPAELLCVLSATETAAEEVSAKEADFTASGIQVDYHTQEEIQQYIREQGITTQSLTRYGSPLTTYETEPSVTEPYEAGKMSSQSAEYALKVFNSVRYIAGLSSVQLKEDYEKAAQAGALVNAANNALSHSPSRPAGMSDELYQLALTGTGKGNLSMGSWNAPYAYHIVQSWMEDSDSYNIDRVGHRRWILNPSMQYTGFGQAESSRGSNYYVVYAHDNAFGSTSQYGVTWPAQNMPIEYFDSSTAWSISMGSQVNESQVTVKLTDLASGDSWNFSDASSDGDFYVNNDNYGKKGCIIFRPSSQMAYQDGDTYQVEITGLETPVIYRVNFFTLKENVSPTPVVSEDVQTSQSPDVAASSTPQYSENPDISASEIPQHSETPGATGSAAPPSVTPGIMPSQKPQPSAAASFVPGVLPEPSEGADITPSATPDNAASSSPPVSPTPSSPAVSPTVMPSSPVAPPTVMPSSPAVSPTVSPTVKPKVSPTVKPTSSPKVSPTVKPAASPKVSPTVSPDAGEKSPLSRGKVRSLTNKKGRRLVVKIKPQKNCSGYQVQYGLYWNMKHSKKIVTGTPSVTLKGLKRRKVYYVRVRAYRVTDGVRRYGAWSAVRKKRIKK